MFSRHALNTKQQKLRIKSAVIGPSWTEIRITLYPMSMMLMVIIMALHAYIPAMTNSDHGVILSVVKRLENCYIFKKSKSVTHVKIDRTKSQH